MTARVVGLDARAIAHIEAELKVANPLGRGILQHHNLTAGRSWSVVPEGPIGDIYDFRSGIHRTAPVVRNPVPGGFVESVPSTDGWVTAWLSDVMEGWRDALLLSESFLLRATDLPRIQPGAARMLACGDFVYLAADRLDSREALTTVVRTAYEVPLGLGVLTRIGSDSPSWLHDRKTLGDSELGAIFASLVLLMLGAYDGESVLLWTPPGVSLPRLGQ